MTGIDERLQTALAERYSIQRELGAGGMATVYLAHDIRHDRDVAIKVLRPELAAVIGADRFLSEIKTTAHLQHPHILSLFDSGTVDGTVFYVMPFVDGESLRDRLAREKQLPVDDALRIAHEVADALQYAHQHGIIHRDIKPENILLNGEHALVADFGIALAAAKTGGARMTETGMSLGTPQYMSPEQAMGERDITARTDVYALGAVLYEMLLGEPPFTGPTAQAIVARVLTEEPRSLSAQRRMVPSHVGAAVTRALQKLPADRFVSAAAFAEALSHPGAEALSQTAIPGRTILRPPTHRWLAFAPWVLAFLAIGIAVWSWQTRPPTPQVSWLPITMGDTIGISQAGNALALSPDGRSLVFREARANGRLWIKQWDQLDAAAIPGTERALDPVFSPDGNWVAFTADGQIRKIRVTGGAPITLVDSASPTAYGIAWMDDGTIVYPSTSGDQLRRVSSDGGTSAVALADTAFRGFGLLNSSPLPQSHAVIFTACTSGCVTTSVEVADLRTGMHTLLINDAYAAWYLPTGYLLYIRRDATALIVPFDLDKLAIHGTAVPVLSNVIVVSGVPELAWSRSGTLVYARGNGSPNSLEITSVSREGISTPIDTNWFGGFNSFALSPDGRRMAVGAGTANGALNIWIKQLDTGPFSRLTYGGRDRRPVWSPDGRTVAFIREKGTGGAVYARATDGSSNEKLLARLDRPIQEIAWSDDGLWLVARTDNSAAGEGDIVGIRTSGDTTPVPLVATKFTENQPAISHDSHWLAYTSDESGTSEVYVRPFPETSRGRWQVSTDGGTQPVWSADGRDLFFVDGTTRLVDATLQTTPAFQVLGLHPLFDVTRFTIDPFHQAYTVTRDGRGFLFARTHSSGNTSGAPQMVLVENWFADLYARAKR